MQVGQCAEKDGVILCPCMTNTGGTGGVLEKGKMDKETRKGTKENMHREEMLYENEF